MSATHMFDEQAPARYCVGIDLGTTNCAVAYVDTQAKKRRIEQFLIEQLIDEGTFESRTTLPSFLYQFPADTSSETPGVVDELGCKFCVGWYARTRGAEQPQRQISSAKSWLCHGGVDRLAKLLPWDADDDVVKLSPVAACSRYLDHIRQAWDAKHPDAPLAEQEVVITLPASFDEVARELTVDAAKQAGLTRILLIEEPQAAFYAWLAQHQHDWSELVRAGQSVLICDIGGGTTDFTLIRVRELSPQAKNDDALTQQYGLHRVAVGEHLLLGGDNLDAALAAHVEQLAIAASQSISARQWDQLRMRCRQAKEVLLSDDSPDKFSVFLSGTGRRLIEAGQTFDISRSTAIEKLLEGFFPSAELQDKPADAQEGFREFGLPYAKDPAITRHLAKFLWDHRFAGRPIDEPVRLSDLSAARPDWILFNGGVTASSRIRQRIIDQVNAWFSPTIPNWSVGELTSTSLDLAVSQGAAYFALVKRGEGLDGNSGIRIDARLARAYFLQVQAAPPAVLCVMPANAQPLQQYAFAQHPIQVEIGRPVQFPLYYSSTRLNDAAGDIVELDNDSMLPLPLIQTVLQGKHRKQIKVTPAIVESQLSEIGTLQLHLHAANHSADLQTADVASERWKLEFDLRSTVQTERQHHAGDAERAGVVNQADIRAVEAIIRQSLNQSTVPSMKNLMREASEAIQVPRQEWPASLLRELWSSTISVDRSERKSVEAESRWLGLLGFFLRPGFGFAADDWRVAQTWRAVQGKLQHRSNASEATVLWRRIAGGFTTGQQQSLLQESQPVLLKILNGNLSGVSNGYASELIRLIGSLELVSMKEKQFLANALIPMISKEKLKALHAPIIWSIGRLAARQPVYGPLNCVVSASFAEEVIERLVAVKSPEKMLHSAVVQAARMTGDRYRDINHAVRAKAVAFLKRHDASERQLREVEEVVQLDTQETAEILGEALPLGIQLRRL